MKFDVVCKCWGLWGCVLFAKAVMNAGQCEGENDGVVGLRSACGLSFLDGDALGPGIVGCMPYILWLGLIPVVY